MTIITPIHQFEIRYSNILNFPHVIAEVIAPYVQLTSKVNIDNEFSHKQQIALNFEQDFYIITATWDRLIIQTNGLREGLSENNSIVDNPFFDIFNKIKDLKEFGVIKNILYYSLNINSGKEELNTVKTSFINKYLTENTKDILPDIEDTAIVLECHKDNHQIHITFGPYMGQQDLKRRKILVKNPNILDKIDEYGEMLEFKYYEENNPISFPKYKKIAEVERKYFNKLWIKK